MVVVIEVVVMEVEVEKVVGDHPTTAKQINSSITTNH